MEIGESKLFCPIALVFPEWDRIPVKTLAIAVIETERSSFPHLFEKSVIKSQVSRNCFKTWEEGRSMLS
jgi:hypothetical protein